MDRKPLYPLSLKTKVTLLTLGIFLLSFWSLAFYASRMLREDMQQQLGDQQLSVVTFIASAIDDHLYDRTNALDQLSQKITPSLLADTAGLQHLLDYQLVLQSLFSGGVFVTGDDGTALAEVPRSMGRSGINFMDQAALAAAFREGRPRIGAPAVGKQPQEPAFEMVVPLLEATGRPVGAVIGVIALQRADFLDHLTKNLYGKTGGYFLVARQERLIIAATRKERIMQPLSPRGAIPAIDRFVDGLEGSQVYTNPQGIEVLNSVKRLNSVDWGVSASISTAEAFAPIRAMQQRMMMVVVLMTVLVGLLTWWMLRRQLSPLLDTAKALAQMSAVDHPPSALPIARQDEIGELIGGFNHLLGTLAQREAALKASEHKLFTILESVEAHIFLKDTGRRYLFANRPVRELFGVGLDDIIGQTDEHFFDASNAAHTRAVDCQVLETGVQIKTEESRLNRRSGHKSTYLVHKLPLRDERGVIYALCGISTDITAHKDSEEYERFRSHILEMLAGGAELDLILLAIVQGIETLYPSVLCSIALLDGEGQHFVKNFAPSLPEYFNRFWEGCAIGPDAGSCGRAAFLRERVIVEDIPTHPYWTQYRDLARRAGLGACWSQPILSSSNRILGTFAMYHHEMHSPREADLLLIEQAARLASIALDRSLAEAKLRDSEERYRLLIESSTEGIYVIEAGLIRFCNPAMVEQLGYCQDELLDRPLMDFMHEEDRESMLDLYRRQISGVMLRTRHQGRFLNKQKGVRWFDIGSIRIDWKGQTATLNFLTDVTEHKQAEEVLHQSKAFVQAVLDSVASQIAVIDQAGVIVAINAAWRHFSLENPVESGRLAPHSGVGTNYLQVCAAANSANAHGTVAACSGIRAVLEGLLPTFNLEYPCPSPQGPRWFLMTVTPLGTDGRGAVIVHSNFTARKIAEETLRLREEQLRFVLEGAELGYWDWNLAAGTVERNARWAKMLGYTLEELQATAQQWADFVHPEDRERAWQSIHDTLEGHSAAHQIEYRMLHKDGSFRWILDQARVTQRDAAGRPLRMCGTHSDVTGRKRIEEQIHNLAYYDPLTQLPNRRMLSDRLTLALANSKRNEQFGALLLLDLDNFKPLNDEHGHAVGDLLLVEVARRLDANIREVDTIARLGGDEFVVVLSSLYDDAARSAEQAMAIAGKLRLALEQSYRLALPQEDYPVSMVEHQCSCSIGITLFHGQEISQNEILRRADQAMYQAKQSGRNTIHLCSENHSLQPAQALVAPAGN